MPGVRTTFLISLWSPVPSDHICACHTGRRIHNMFVRGWIPLLFNYRHMTTKRDIDLRRKHLTLQRWLVNQAILLDVNDRDEQCKLLALQGWQNKGPRKPWFKWRAVAFCASTVERALRRLRYRGMALALAGWKEMIATAQHSTALKRRGVTTFLDKRSRLGLNTWLAYAHLRSEALRKLQRGVSAFVNGLLRHFWNAYSEIARQNVRNARLIQQAVGKLVHRSQIRGFNPMREVWYGRRRALTSMSRAVAEWQKRGPLKPWLKWRRVASCRNALRIAILSIRGRRPQPWPQRLFVGAESGQHGGRAAPWGTRRRGAHECLPQWVCVEPA